MTCKITKAGAWCNGEVAYLAWDIEETIDGCLGFMITRVHETGEDAGVRRCLPSWIAFTDQSNPNWIPQDTSVWPIQNFEWRDLTLRRSRDTTAVRPIDFRVHYEIVPVGTAAPGRGPVPASATAMFNDPTTGKPNYTGAPRPLFLIGEPFVTNPIDVTHKYTGPNGSIEATFTNGILSTQNLLLQLRNAIAKHGNAPHARGDRGSLDSTAGLLAELKNQIKDPQGDIRKFLTADVLSFLRRFLDEAAQDDSVEVYLALYELHDPELIKLLDDVAKLKRIHIVLSTAGQAKPPKGSHQPVVWDTENNDARARLHKSAPDRVFDRMFNNSVPIGHDKFAVYVKNGKAQKVLTGSTNWTETGLCTQSNNSLIVSDPTIAGFYLDFWNRLAADKQPARVPTTTTDGHGKTVAGAEPNHAIQGPEIRRANSHPFGPAKLGDGSQTTVWFSPNTASARKTPDSPMPPDLNDIYTLMDHAKESILFLTFMPGVAGQQNIIGEAARLANERPELLVLGAISDPKALPPQGNVSKGKEPKRKAAGKPPTVWWRGGKDSQIAMVQATAISTPVGDLHPELLSAGHAIIHDKIIVIDPLDAENCAVITGSHNLGYKASYDNDENLLIIKGNPGLAISYAVHVIDVYQHYLMRAKQEELSRKSSSAGKQAKTPSANHGFLATKDDWQERFFGDQPLTAMSYFLAHA